MKLLANQLSDDQVEQELAALLSEIAKTCIQISNKVRLGALAGILGSAEQENVQGETQKKLDVIANDLIKDALAPLPQVRAIASEEEDNTVVANAKGAYVVAFDPLDGSSNIDINGQIGTIFTVYPARDDVDDASDLQFAQPGRAQVAAGYVLYRPSTQLALTTGGPSRLYTLVPEDQQFQLTEAALSIAPLCNEFSINMSNVRHWSPAMQAYIQELQAGSAGPREKDFNMRWNGAMVGDVHRVLMRGGIFLYPANTQSKVHGGKLRLLYEANPMALLIEKAGGKAITDTTNILDIEPSELHQRVPVVLGSAAEVDRVQSL